MSTKASQSPRVKAHSVKVSGKKMKKKSSSRAFVDTMESVTSQDEFDSLNSPRPMDRSITSLAEEKTMGQVFKQSINGQDLLQIQMQLAKAMDDTSILRSRLRAELEHRQVLENKISDLTEKLSEARRGLSETKGALNKVQTVASQLITKRDEREVQLQQALDQNGIYERKIAELEMHISHLSHINEQNSGPGMEKQVQNYAERERALEDTVAEMKEKLSQARKENVRIAEEKENLEFMLEAKKKRILMLEEHASRMSENGTPADVLASTRDSLLMSMLDFTRASTANNNNGNNSSNNNNNGVLGSPSSRSSIGNTNPFAAAIASAVAAANGNNGGDVSQFENKISSLESDKRGLEDRLVQMERQLLEQQKMQMQQQQLQMQQQQKMQQQMQMQMQMAQQQAMMAASAAAAGGGGGGGGVGGSVTPGSAQMQMRNSGSRASTIRMSNGAVTPTSGMANMSLAPLSDAASRLTASNTLANANPIVGPPISSPNLTNTAATVSAAAPVASMVSASTPTAVPIAATPQLPALNTSVNNNNNNNSGGNNSGYSTLPVVTAVSAPVMSPGPSNHSTPAVPQQALAEADAQAVLREILSSRERPRPKTVERPRSNDGVHVSSNGAGNTNNNNNGNSNNNNNNSSSNSNNNNANSAVSPSNGNRSRAGTRDSMNRSSSNNNNNARVGSSRATRASVNRDNSNSANGSTANTNTSLPVQNQTPNFKPSTANDPMRAALETTQAAYANNTLSSQPFETNVRDTGSAVGSVRPSMSRLASRYIKPDEDPEEAKAKLNEEKRVSKKKIMEWMKKFQQEFGREPSKQERESGAGQWYKEYRQISKVLKELDGGATGPGASSRASMIIPDMDDD